MKTIENTPVQRRFKDIQTLRDAEIPLLPEELAHETGGHPEDLEGIHVVQESPGLKKLSDDQKNRLIEMGGYSDDGGKIGVARLLEDVRQIIARFKKK